MDVTLESEVKAAVDAAVERWGRLDCIFNNAGFGGALGPIESIGVDDYDMTFTFFACTACPAAKGADIHRSLAASDNFCTRSGTRCALCRGVGCEPSATGRSRARSGRVTDA